MIDALSLSIEILRKTDKILRIVNNVAHPTNEFSNVKIDPELTPRHDLHLLRPAFRWNADDSANTFTLVPGAFYNLA